jgi:nicotinate-nucleotide adenylyltransferase
VVVSRPGFRFEDLKRLSCLGEAAVDRLRKLDQDRMDRDEFPLTSSTRLILLRVRPWEVSATEIRNHLSGGKRKRNLLPPRVESYIMSHQLYAYSK